MHFRSKIPISQRKLTPSQHTQTPETQNQKFFFSIFCRQKLLGKIFWSKSWFLGSHTCVLPNFRWSKVESDPHVQVMEMSYEAIVEGILYF